MTAASAAGAQGRIGPNAVIRLAEALEAVEGHAAASGVFRASRLEHYLEVPPTGMVAEDEVATLHGELHQALGDRRARSVAWIAGQRTADYLLAHRIPAPAQRLLKALPAALASRLLLVAIGRNAWTFVGTGQFTAMPGAPVVVSIADCPLCRHARSPVPYCEFYAATFERLFAQLVHPQSRAVETACRAMGASACRFEIAWSRRRPANRRGRDAGELTNLARPPR